MTRPRILPLGTPDEPRRPDRLQPMHGDRRSLGELGKLALAVLVLALAGLVATGAWPW